MKLIKALLMAGALGLSSAAFAQDPTAWASKIFTIENGASAALLADRGDINNFVRWVENQKCTGRRAGDLSRAYAGYIEAAVAQDADQMYAAAKHLHTTVNRSKMFQSCWSTMRKQSRAGGASFSKAAQIVALGPKPAG